MKTKCICGTYINIMNCISGYSAGTSVWTWGGTDVNYCLIKNNWKKLALKIEVSLLTKTKALA